MYNKFSLFIVLNAFSLISDELTTKSTTLFIDLTSFSCVQGPSFCITLGHGNYDNRLFVSKFIYKIFSNIKKPTLLPLSNDS